jgi:hypothetical protein
MWGSGHERVELGCYPHIVTQTCLIITLVNTDTTDRHVLQSNSVNTDTTDCHVLQSNS